MISRSNTREREREEVTNYRDRIGDKGRYRLEYREREREREIASDLFARGQITREERNAVGREWDGERDAGEGRMLGGEARQAADRRH